MSKLIASLLCVPAVLGSIKACEPFSTRATSWRHCLSEGSLPAAAAPCAGARSAAESARHNGTTQAGRMLVRSRLTRDTWAPLFRRDLDRTHPARCSSAHLGWTPVDEQWLPARLREPLAGLIQACESDPAILAAWV